MKPNPIHTNDRGFTLIELMVVVSIIALLLGFSVPLVFKLDEMSRDRSGVNTFGVAVTAARAYATRRIADVDSIPQAEYSGAAVLVTPMNQLRIIADLQVDEAEKAGWSAYGYDNQTSRMEAITLPRGVGVVGIVRVDAANVKLIPPPFVIRFNRHGQLMAEDRTADTNSDIQRNVVYFKVGSAPTVKGATRPADYDPTSWDPDVSISSISGRWNQAATDWNLPYEAMESVVGVVVYSKADFDDSGGKFYSTSTKAPVAPVQGCILPPAGCGTLQAGINRWMFENGSVLFFSRNTGNILRTKMP